MGVVGAVGLFIVEIVAQSVGDVNIFLKPKVSVEGGVMRRDGGWRFRTRGGGMRRKNLWPQIDSGATV